MASSFLNWGGVLFRGVLVTRILPFGLCVEAPKFLETRKSRRRVGFLAPVSEPIVESRATQRQDEVFPMRLKATLCLLQCFRLVSRLPKCTWTAVPKIIAFVPR